MAFSALVDLYRLCECPERRGGAEFTCDVNYAKAKPLIEKIKSASIGRFDYISVDGNEINGELPDSGYQVSFGFTLPKNSTARFYEDYEDFLKKAGASLSRGEMPLEFYLAPDDYYSGDSEEPPLKIKILKDICELIHGLFQLAHYHDGKYGNSKLVFIGPSKNSEIKPVEIEVKIEAELLDALSPFETRLVKELSDDRAINDPHYSAKVGVFGTCLAEFVGGRPSGGAFEYLLLNWTEFARVYHRDLSTYLSGFAFHKAKIEVAEAELKIANEFSKVLNDILGKLLGIPVSFAAVLAIQKGDGLAKQLFIMTGVLIACWILSRVVANQQRQFKRIENSKNIVIDAIEGKKEAYPEDLKNEVEGLSKALENNSDFLEKTLCYFRILCWLPLGVGSMYLLYLYCNDVLKCILRLSSMLSCG